MRRFQPEVQRRPRCRNEGLVRMKNPENNFALSAPGYDSSPESGDHYHPRNSPEHLRANSGQQRPVRCRFEIGKSTIWTSGRTGGAATKTGQERPRTPFRGCGGQEPARAAVQADLHRTDVRIAHPPEVRALRNMSRTGPFLCPFMLCSRERCRRARKKSAQGGKVRQGMSPSIANTVEMIGPAAR